MSEREKTIAEIREALAKATPWPWKIDEFGAVTDRKGNLIQWYDGKVVTARKDDAHLIANAPEWLGFLLSQLDREREENRKLREERDDLIEGLKVYAEQRIGSDDDGEHARDILREIGVTVE